MSINFNGGEKTEFFLSFFFLYNIFACVCVCVRVYMYAACLLLLLDLRYLLLEEKKSIF